MKKHLRDFLKITLFVDFLITCGFGFVSWLFPNETFGTIILIPEAGREGFLALLSSQSLSYIFIGLVCLIGVKEHFPTKTWIGSVMLLRHLVVNILGIINIDQAWIIGNPYHDIVIHFLFIFAYIVGIIISIKQNKIIGA